ncbi:TPA: hypothetical protein ACH3X2_013810 [Trebouxia sp. C0005]
MTLHIHNVHMSFHRVLKSMLAASSAISWASPLVIGTPHLEYRLRMHTLRQPQLPTRSCVSSLLAPADAVIEHVCQGAQSEKNSMFQPTLACHDLVCVCIKTIYTDKHKHCSGRVCHQTAGAACLPPGLAV